MHEENEFITLTYAPEKLESLSLRHRDYQLFMKRLRKSTKKKISYYMAGEYGSNHRRPHFHACLFGMGFSDRKYWKTTASKSKLYTSETLTNLWGKGFASTGNVTFESAAYIARYIMDKKTGKDTGRYYEQINEETGEITDLLPEYNAMSLKPAIGKRWLQKYLTDVYPEGQILVNKHKSLSPKYYDTQYKKLNPILYEELKQTRELQSLEYRGDNTPLRLRSKELVALAKTNQLLRSLPY